MGRKIGVDQGEEQIKKGCKFCEREKGFESTPSVLSLVILRVDVDTKIELQ